MFGEVFAKTGHMERELGKALREAYQSRLGCDYDSEHEETRQMAEATPANARSFLAAAEKRLKVEIEKLKS